MYLFPESISTAATLSLPDTSPGISCKPHTDGTVQTVLLNYYILHDTCEFDI